MKNQSVITAWTLSLVVSVVLPTVDAQARDHNPLSEKQRLGKALFFDTELSNPPGQSCASCHSPLSGWTGPDADINAHGGVYEGAVAGRFGNRKPPSAAYAAFSPMLEYSQGDGGFVGGNFWDGRATGEHLGTPAADQAQGPFLNPLEQNNESAQQVCDKVLASTYPRKAFHADYQTLFRRAFGENALNCETDVAGTFNRIARAIAAFEASSEVSQFSSKFDAYLQGKARLSYLERRGLRLFKGEAKCSQCHSIDPPAGDTPALFTDNSFENIGVPANPENPFYHMPAEFNPLGKAWVDRGLQGFVETRNDFRRYATESAGKMRVPTLRNVAKKPNASFVKAFMHNGVFKDLRMVVHFYNTRDVLPACDSAVKPRIGVNCWPLPEVSQTVNTKDTGKLGLSRRDEEAIVAFLGTLSDGYRPRDCDEKRH